MPLCLDPKELIWILKMPAIAQYEDASFLFFALVWWSPSMIHPLLGLLEFDRLPASSLSLPLWLCLILFCEWAWLSLVPYQGQTRLFLPNRLRRPSTTKSFSSLSPSTPLMWMPYCVHLIAIWEWAAPLLIQVYGRCSSFRQRVLLLA